MNKKKLLWIRLSVSIFMLSLWFYASYSVITLPNTNFIMVALCGIFSGYNASKIKKNIKEIKQIKIMEKIKK